MWLKISRERFESVATVILRVPGLFVIDYWWQHERTKSFPATLQWQDVMGAIITNLETAPTERSFRDDENGVLKHQTSINRSETVNIYHLRNPTHHYKKEVAKLHEVLKKAQTEQDGKEAVSSKLLSEVNRKAKDAVSQTYAFLENVLVQGFLLMLLPLPRLVDLYMHYISASLLAVAHLYSHQYVLLEEEIAGSTTDDASFLRRQLTALAIHVFLESLVAFLLDVQHNLGRMLLATYSLPVVIRLSGFPVTTLMVVHNFASAFMILQTLYYVIIYIPRLVDYLRLLYLTVTADAELYGWFGIFVTLWNRLFVPVLLLTFWFIQLIAQIYQYTVVTHHPILKEEWYVVLLTCISNICNSPISLAGTCVALVYLSYCSLSITKFYLQGYNAFIIDNVMHSGWTEGITMVLLSLQTGLIDLKMPGRTAVMSIILFIVLSSLIQSMFEIAEPIMLALSASHNKSIQKHVRTIVLCVFLFVFPLYMTYMLCLVFPIDFWMLVVISSCVMTSVQVFGLFVIYVLFMYDALKTEPWDSLDDIVYYCRAFTRVLEFVVAVFVVGAGMFESVAGQWSWINSSVLLIHCYFNVWQRLQSGWKSFLLRREAVRKIESLPLATPEQLKAYNDICVICYTDLKNARITSCRHFFHGTCLRKWLYIQDNCPMCHAPISLVKNENETESEMAANDDGLQAQ